MIQCIFWSSVWNSDGLAEMYNWQELMNDSVFSCFLSKGNRDAILGSRYLISGFSGAGGGVLIGGRGGLGGKNIDHGSGASLFDGG